MATSNVSATWCGTLKGGKGTFEVASKIFDGIELTYASRFERLSAAMNDSSATANTNPEELIGAAHAGCYSMFLSALLSNEGLNPESVKTNAEVTLGDGPKITSI